MKSSVAKLCAVILAIAMFAASTQFAQAQATSSPRTKPVAAGEAAPDFTLEGHVGGKFSLSAEAKKQPVLLVFYRGYW